MAIPQFHFTVPHTDVTGAIPLTAPNQVTLIRLLRIPQWNNSGGTQNFDAVGPFDPGEVVNIPWDFPDNPPTDNDGTNVITFVARCRVEPEDPSNPNDTLWSEFSDPKTLTVPIAPPSDDPVVPAKGSGELVFP